MEMAGRKSAACAAILKDFRNVLFSSSKEVSLLICTDLTKVNFLLQHVKKAKEMDEAWMMYKGVGKYENKKDNRKVRFLHLFCEYAWL